MLARTDQSADLNLDKDGAQLFTQALDETACVHLAWCQRMARVLALGIDHSSVRYVSHKPDQAPLRLRIHDLAAARMRYGYFRVYILLRREGWLVNHKALLSLPKGAYYAPQNTPREIGFGHFPFWTGQAFNDVEGQTFMVTLDAAPNKQFF